ncbi:hypothetical protein Pst134EB_027582 [Puccinia striiformis f. sp. tritici]|nr:hypothetical protein Pst134EB_027582 [Puccinia striiformis f. sp. tritici]
MGRAVQTGLLRTGGETDDRVRKTHPGVQQPQQTTRIPQPRYCSWPYYWYTDGGSNRTWNYTQAHPKRSRSCHQAQKLSEFKRKIILIFLSNPIGASPTQHSYTETLHSYRCTTDH